MDGALSQISHVLSSLSLTFIKRLKATCKAHLYIFLSVATPANIAGRVHVLQLHLSRAGMLYIQKKQIFSNSFVTWKGHSNKKHCFTAPASGSIITSISDVPVGSAVLFVPKIAPSKHKREASEDLRKPFQK